MKIIFNIIGVDPPFNTEHGGAIGKLVGYQIDYLQKRGFKVIAFVDKESYFKKEGIRVISYKGRSSCDNTMGFILYGFIQFIRICKVDADIIISTHPRNVVSSFLYSKFKKKKWVAWVLDHVFWVRPITRVKCFYHRLIRLSTKISALSSQQRKRILEKIKDSERIALIYGCINSDKFTPLGFTDRQNYILYVAKFTERKNHLVLIKAFEKVIDKDDFYNLKLFLVGSKEGIFVKRKRFRESFCYLQCQSYVKEKDLSEKVSFLDVINEDELIKLYRKAKLFIMPSLEEGFGLTLLEAMACGCCCLVNDIEPLNEIIGDCGVTMDASSKDDIAEKISWLLKDENLREKFGNLARERAREIFAVEKATKDFLSLLEAKA